MISLNNSKNIFLIFILLSSIIIPATISSGNVPVSKTLTTSPSCTIFSIALNDTVFFGNNEDYYEKKLYI